MERPPRSGPMLRHLYAERSVESSVAAGETNGPGAAIESELDDASVAATATGIARTNKERSEDIVWWLRGVVRDAVDYTASSVYASRRRDAVLCRSAPFCCAECPNVSNERLHFRIGEHAAERRHAGLEAFHDLAGRIEDRAADICVVRLACGACRELYVGAVE